MFDSLSEKLGRILDRLTRRGALSEADVEAALREVRRALLEADVALDVAREFTEQVKEKAVGVEVMKSVTPGQMVVKIVHDQLVATLGADGQTIDLAAAPPVAIMMVGLQGSGKTTTTAKIARRLADRQKQKVLMASLDVRRPAAMEQLAVLGRDAQDRHAADRRRPDAAADRPARARSGAPRRLRRGAARHRRPHHARRSDDERGGRGQARRQSARSAAGRRRADRPGRGQSRARVRRARRPDRHRAHPRRRRRPRRRRALDARGHRQADQADRHRREARRAGGIRSRRASPAASSAWATSSRWSRRPPRNIDAEKAMRAAEKMRKGAFDLGDLREQLTQMQKHGRHGRPDGHAARHRQDEEPDRQTPTSTRASSSGRSRSSTR